MSQAQNFQEVADALRRINPEVARQYDELALDSLREDRRHEENNSWMNRITAEALERRGLKT